MSFLFGKKSSTPKAGKKAPADVDTKGPERSGSWSASAWSAAASTGLVRDPDAPLTMADKWQDLKAEVAWRDKQEKIEFAKFLKEHYIVSFSPAHQGL